VAPPRVLTRPMAAFAYTFVAGFCAALTVLAPSTHAYAAPDPATVEAQIDDMWNKLEPIIEQYNQVHSQLLSNKAKSASLQRRIQPLQLQVDLALARVSDIAAEVYKGGPASAINAILSSGSPETLADQLALLNMLARGQRQTISNVATARDKYAADKKALDILIAQEAQQDAELAAKKKQIEDQIAALQKLRQQAYGSGAGTGVLKPAACPYEYIGGAPGKAATVACAQIGKPYVWAAEGPNSFDCSGLTLYAWKAAGVTLGHYTVWQHNETARVSRADLRPGDLVFYFSDLHHVGMYVGGGWIVHAPRPGDYVRMARMDAVGSINSFGRPG
jgi:peptidoglycan DL-endopeptidase CwlO